MLKLFSRLFSLGAAATLALAGTAGYYHYALPDSFYVTKGTELALHTALPIESAAEGDAPAYAAETVPMRGSVSLRLFGFLPSSKPSGRHRVSRYRSGSTGEATSAPCP